MKIIEQTDGYIYLGNNEDENIAIYDEEVRALGGVAFRVGEVCGSPEMEAHHEHTLEVLQSWGLDTDSPIEIIVIKNKRWSNCILREILGESQDSETVRFKRLMDRIGYSYRDIERITGNSYDSIKTGLQKNKELPRWCKLILHMFEEADKEKRYKMIDELLS